jgi:DNA transformation protein and related proteins
LAFSKDFAEFVIGQMAGIGRVTSRKMFGECGLYAGSVLFAVIADDILYLKARGSLADELKAAGSQPFTYPGRNGKPVAMPYWRAPDDCLEEPDKMAAWCRKSLSAAAAEVDQQKTPAKKKSRTS